MIARDSARNRLTPVAAVWSDAPKSGSVGVGVLQPVLYVRTTSADGNRLALTHLELLLASDLLAGYDDAEIARRASLSQRKLDACVAAMFEKLGVRDSLELALLLVHNGL